MLLWRNEGEKYQISGQNYKGLTSELSWQAKSF